MGGQKKNHQKKKRKTRKTKKKPKIKEIIDLIISSYEKFFIDLNLYNYENFKKKAEKLAIKKY